jgi:hypothetical protein
VRRQERYCVSIQRQQYLNPHDQQQQQQRHKQQQKINNNYINNTTTTVTHYYEQHSLPQLCPCCVDAGDLERNLLSETKCCPDSTSGSGSDAGPIRKHSSPDFQWMTSASEIDGKEKNRMMTETTLFNFTSTFSFNGCLSVSPFFWCTSSPTSVFFVCLSSTTNFSLQRSLSD